jgi:cobalt-zinc-cadmium efflux system outer membrane protein
MSPVFRWASCLAAAAIASPASAAPLTFADALRAAGTTAPSLEARALEVQASRSAARAAGALPDPKLAFGIDNFPVSGPPAGRFSADEMTMARVGIMQEVPSAARRRAQVAASQADISVAQAQAGVEARKVRVATALAWIDLAYAERRLAALDQLTAGLKGVWEAQPASVASGAARPAQGLEPTRLRAQFEDMRSELVAAVTKARAELARWTGDPAASAVGDPPPFHIDAASLRSELENNPTLLAYRSVSQRAEAQADAARAGKRPDWAFDLSYQRRDPMFGDMVSAGVTVSLPLFARTRQEPVIAARLADVNRVRVEREDARRALAAALDADLADHVMHHDQWTRSMEVLVPAAEQRAHLELESYAAGRADFGDVMDALNGLAETKLRALEREAMVTRDGARIVLTYGGEP